MTVTFDQPLGSAQVNGVTNASFTTGAAAAANSRIVACVSWNNTSASTMAVTIGGTGATQDLLVTNGTDFFSVFSLVVAGGLASSSTITASQAISGQGGELVAACSYLGTTGIDTTAQNTTTGTSFSSGSAQNAVADSLFVGGAGNESTITTVGGTNTNGTSRFDIWESGSTQGMRMLDLIASSIASRALTGTWSSTTSATTGGLVIYKGTAAAVTATVFTPRRMPAGV